MNILVIGGTRFFGKKLVSNLISEEHQVTLLTRGNLDLPYPDRVSHIKADRGDFAKALNDHNGYWDIVYDQICYCSNDAAATLKAIKGKAGKLIVASSEAVYQNGLNKSENDFDPTSCSIQMGTRSDFSYPEGKRQAEAYLYQNIDIPVIAARIPFVFGQDDYTNRFHEVVNAIAQERSIDVLSLQARLSIIHAIDIAKALCELKDIHHQGPINIAAKDPISIEHLLNQIEDIVGKKAILKTTSSEQALTSDFFTSADRSISPELYENFGMEIPAIEYWLGDLISDIFRQMNPADLRL